MLCKTGRVLAPLVSAYQRCQRGNTGRRLQRQDFDQRRELQGLTKRLDDARGHLDLLSAKAEDKGSIRDVGSG